MIPITRPCLNEKEAQAAYDVVMSGWVVQGPKVLEFEEVFAAYTGSRYAIAVSSCTTALHLALKVAAIGVGDEVICPSMSYIATANSIVHSGAVPVFAEVKPVTYNLDIEDAARRITNKTKAILLVHQIGMPADIDGFSSLCKKHNLILIEDAACALGSEYKGKRIGSHNDLVCFSFHPRKVITTGDGGMVCTNNKAFADRLRTLRQHSMDLSPLDRHNNESKMAVEKYDEVGYNYRMTDIQAAVGIEQMKKMADIVSSRRSIAYKYHDAFKHIHWIDLPYEPSNCISNYQSYSIYLNKKAPIKRDEFMTIMTQKGISTRRGIMTAHIERAYADLNYKLPVTEDLSENSVLIPIYAGLSEEDISYIIRAVIELDNRTN
ncbi:MAG: DegT/DnrJ/EryC1/StrS family aminotransferase [Bacteroidales bacterium]|nr:DegT/DnrJ/EryC1/StrS family aminotransferase [Bacteroidales bacterium]